MTVNEARFIFDNEDSDKYGVFLCSFGSTSTDSNDEESNIVTTTNSFKDTWDLHYVDKSSPLQRTFTIAKKTCAGIGEYFNAEEERRIKKWLCKKKRAWFQPIQDDLSNIYYYCILINPRKVDVGGRNAGIQFTMVCDAPYAWSELKKKSYICNGVLNFSFNNVTDFDDYILRPQFIITPTINGTIKIKNNTTNTELVINNCTSSETIYIDNNADKIESSNGRVLLSDWNKSFIDIVEGINNFTLTGNFKLEIKYRLPIRVGG